MSDTTEMTSQVSVARATGEMPLPLRSLLDAGVHFGHQTKRWNPKMRPFIYGARNGIHIIDLDQTARLFKRAYDFVVETVGRGGHILIVGTKRQAQEIVHRRGAARSRHVLRRRTAGSAARSPTSAPSSRASSACATLERMKEDGTYEQLPKKEVSRLEKERERLEKYLGGLKSMGSLPHAVFVIDPHQETIAVQRGAASSASRSSPSPTPTAIRTSSTTSSRATTTRSARSSSSPARIADAVRRGRRSAARSALAAAPDSSATTLTDLRRTALARADGRATESNGQPGRSRSFEETINGGDHCAAGQGASRAHAGGHERLQERARREPRATWRRPSRSSSRRASSRARSAPARSRPRARSARSSRPTARRGVIVEVNSQTDFAARNDEFKEFVEDVYQARAQAPRRATTWPAHVPGLAARPSPRCATSSSPRSARTSSCAAGPGRGRRPGRRRARVRAPGRQARRPSRGVGASAQVAGARRVQEVRRRRGDADRGDDARCSSCAPRASESAIAKQKEIFVAQLEEEKKPEAGVAEDHRGQGRQVVHRDLPPRAGVGHRRRARRSSKSRPRSARHAGGPVQVKRFVRFERGEGIEKQTDDFAAEVAKMAGQ